MRELIRPGLFWMARLGLFLSVVAWGLGQWWHAKAACSFGTTLLSEHGWYVQNSGRTRKMRLSIVPIESVLPSNKLVIDWRFNRVNAAPIDHEGFLTSVYFNGSSMSEFSGVVVINTPFLRHWSISTRHWLIVTIFALFYGVLKWGYRKRGTEAVRDE